MSHFFQEAVFGEIQFDFENGVAEIVRLAEWDTMNSHVFAERIIQHILSLPEGHLPGSTTVVFEGY